MNIVNQLLSPADLRLMAITLLHFLWQGAALAALAYAALAFCRTASSRYAVTVAMLLLMAAAPGITLFALLSQERGVQTVNAGNSAVNPPAIFAGAASILASPSVPAPGGVSNYFLWLVEIWFVGVIVFSLRSAGGVLLVERLRRKESRSVTDQVLKLCLDLQDKIGVKGLVRFCECVRLEAPAVAGWLRPVVLLPVSALIGLTEAQLSSVIAHELAHIKRFDSFVNLFQIAVETILFYHPAVWWLNKQIRAERENCCDDVAVEVCGSPLTYARALASLAESRTSPRFLLAANSHPLADRVARLLGMGKRGGAIRGADLSLGLFCLSVSLVAGIALAGIARNVHAQSPGRGAIAVSQTQDAVTVRSPRTLAVTVSIPKLGPMSSPTLASMPAPSPSSASARTPEAEPLPQTTSASPATGSSSYIDGLKTAGLDNLTVDQVIALKIQGVTPEFVKSVRELGLHVDIDNLIAMKIQGITSEYVRETRTATGESLDADELIAMKIQGISPDYVKQIRGLGLDADSGDLIAMKVQGISPEYIQGMQKLDLKPDTGNLIAMKIQGVTPEYVKEINALGLHPDTGQLIGMKIQGVDAAYLKKMQAAGFKLSIDDAIGAKVQGVTPEFIEKVRNHGFKDLTLHQLIALKQSGVLDEAKQ